MESKTTFIYVIVCKKFSFINARVLYCGNLHSRIWMKEAVTKRFKEINIIGRDDLMNERKKKNIWLVLFGLLGLTQQ